MSNAERAVRRHMREKATIDKIVKGVPKPKSVPTDQPVPSPTTSTGVPVEEQIRKEWGPDKGGLPVFWRDLPAFLSLPVPARRRA